MRVPLAVLCDCANVSREGKLNILGAFNRLNAGAFPLQWPTMMLVIRLESDPAEMGLKQTLIVKLQGPDGEELISLEMGMVPKRPPGEPTAGPMIGDQILTLNNVVFPKAGDFAFKILINNSLAYTVPIVVAAGKPAGGPPPARS